MGVTFRGSNYVRFVRLGKRTVKDGEMLMVWNVRGVLRRIEGPSLVRLYWSTIRFCTKYTAHPGQYLEVKCANGETQIIPGPTSLFQDHLLHKEIRVRNAINVPAGSCIVVYGDESAGDLLAKKGAETRVTRSLVAGPRAFVPKTSQNVASVPSWDGSNIISLRSHSIVVTASDIKTSDNECMSIEVLVTCKVKNVFTLCDRVTNPTQEIRNAVLSDITAWSQDLTYKDAMKNASALKSFPALQKRVNEMGMVLESCVYRRHEGSSKVDRAKHAKEAKFGAVEDAQKEKDFVLDKELERSQRQIQLASLEHAELMKREKEKRDLEIAFIGALASKGCDITKYLIAKELKGTDIARTLAKDILMGGERDKKGKKKATQASA